MTIADAWRPDYSATATDQRAALKRAVDVVVGVPAALLALPVVAVLALALFLLHRVNPFFWHDRIGHGGRLIPIPKLRTLAPHTDRYADKTIVSLETPSRLARALRASHLDELPQLFLVPFGHLSLVGPRPRMLPEAEQHGDAEYEMVRTSVRQGCTGLWQISHHDSTRVSDHPAYDHFYVRQQTVRLDLWILWRTMRMMLGAGRVHLHEVPRWTLRDPAAAVADLA